MKGTVKWFNPRKGYGFIVGEDGEDYFVHFSSIQAEGYRVLKEAAEVTFVTDVDDNGRKVAKDVMAA